MTNKPCPFCGCADVGIHEGYTFLWRVARCENCGAHGGEVRCSTFGEWETDEWDAQATEAALAVWNTRAPATPWIKPSERLPEDGDLVVAKGPGDLYHVDRYRAELEKLFAEHVTCWMKLPEPRI